MINESPYLNKINVNGSEYKDLPENLYIPPSALRVVLEQFEGPLDLLLYLIKKKNIDPLEINMTEITAQYLRYVEGLSSDEFELAGEYLLMASVLIQIKSKMLLPNETEDLDQEDDPRAALIKKLIEYEKFKNASIELSSFTIHGRDNSKVCLEISKTEPEIPQVSIEMINETIHKIVKRISLSKPHRIDFEKLSVRERMSYLIEKIHFRNNLYFKDLFDDVPSIQLLVVTLLALLQLFKEQVIYISQTDPYSDIYVNKKNENESN